MQSRLTRRWYFLLLYGTGGHETAQARISRAPAILDAQSARKGSLYRSGSGTVPEEVRIVFDTNVFVSAFESLGDSASAALGRILNGEDLLLISKPVIDELLSVLARKFSRDPAYLVRTALFLAEIAETIQPVRQLHVFADDPDNRILECAIAGSADAIVTGDRAMLKLGRYANVRIISLRA
jgi:putative PIN family toxin of toxin-antitoxin system